ERDRSASSVRSRVRPCSRWANRGLKSVDSIGILLDSNPTLALPFIRGGMGRGVGFLSKSSGDIGLGAWVVRGRKDLPRRAALDQLAHRAIAAALGHHHAGAVGDARRLLH